MNSKCLPEYLFLSLSLLLGAMIFLISCLLSPVSAYSARLFPTRTANPFPVFYSEKESYAALIKPADELPVIQQPVSGLTVPHHMLAADLIAQGFARLRDKKYSRIIILSPDHNKWGKTPFSVPGRDFFTCFGKLGLDQASADLLLQNPLVSESNLFSHEHGIQALLPFIAHYFPDVPVLPVTLGVYSKIEHWDSLGESLLPLLDDDTLLVQSTDFSHYLTWAEAKKKDQESLLIIGSGDARMVSSLKQPAHLDSKAALYLQMKLQKERYAARPTVADNKNACEYLPEGEPEVLATTSYIVMYYSTEALKLQSKHRQYVIGGDFFSGRHLSPFLQKTETKQKLVELALEASSGLPLILNFEGIILDNCPKDQAVRYYDRQKGLFFLADSFLDTDDEKKHPINNHKILSGQGPLLCMPTKESIEFLKDINTIAVSTANNHIYDFGRKEAERTEQQLKKAGIIPISQGSAVELEHLSIAAFSELDNAAYPGRSVLTEGDFSFLREWSEQKPLVALVHCGYEFSNFVGQATEKLLATAQKYGVDIFAGSHSHKSSTVQYGINGVVVHSLGNFLFDQLRNTDGSILKLTIFAQGTWWVDQHYIGNIYMKFLDWKKSQKKSGDKD